MQSVLLTGATGLVGGSVLRSLLAADDVQRIVSLGRRPTGFVDTKLKEVSIADFADTSALTPHLEGIDAVFHCLSTYSSMVTRSEYETITLTYLQALLDAAAKSAPQSTFCLFSAAGARPDGGGLSFALRTKGGAENLLFASTLPRKYAFRPAYIAPSHPREKPKFSDTLMTPIFRLLPAIGIISHDLAEVMLYAARHEARSEAVFENGEMRRMLASR